MIGILRYVRAEIIRDGLGGLEHVEALLRARGAEPEAQYVPRKQPKHFRRGELSMTLLRMLRNGPRPGAELAREIAAANGLDRRRACGMVNRALYRLRDRGLVRAEKDRAGRYVWGLAL